MLSDGALEDPELTNFVVPDKPVNFGIIRAVRDIHSVFRWRTNLWDSMMIEPNDIEIGHIDIMMLAVWRQRALGGEVDHFCREVSFPKVDNAMDEV